MLDRGFLRQLLDHAPKEAGWVLNQIGHLYNSERNLRRQRAGPVLRDGLSCSQSVPICRTNPSLSCNGGYLTDASCPGARWAKLSVTHWPNGNRELRGAHAFRSIFIWLDLH